MNPDPRYQWLMRTFVPEQVAEKVARFGLDAVFKDNWIWYAFVPVLKNGLPDPQSERTINQLIYRYGLDATYQLAVQIAENENVKRTAKVLAAAAATALAAKAANNLNIHPLGAIRTMQDSAQASFQTQLDTLNPYNNK